MRKFLILIYFLIPYCCYAQFFDDFSDSATFKKNNWQGDISHFSIKEQNLRLVNKIVTTIGNIQSYLSAPVSLPSPICCWDFEAELNFNPSISNYARFYLIADKASLKTHPNGYFVQLGGSADEITLCRQEGTEIIPLLSVPQRLTARNSNTIKIHVLYSSGKWELSSCFNSEIEFQSHGSAVSILSARTGYLGWVCNYTKTYSSHFYLYQVIVSDCKTSPFPPINPDEKPTVPNDTVYIENGTQLIENDNGLKIDSVEVLDKNKLLIHFNHPINISKASISVDPKEYSLKLAPTQFHHIIHATIQPELKKNKDYYFIWSGIYDLNGKLFDGNTFSFRIEDNEVENPPVPPTALNIPSKFGELIITEIMANPKGSPGLPEAEYIELFNRTDRELLLENCTLYYATKKYPLPAYNLLSGNRVILCNESNSNMFHASIPVLAMPAFPILANTGKLIYLENKSGELLHWIEYSDKWYATSKQKSGGYSLEMIDTDYLYSSPLNWSGSTASAGGTPGMENGIARNNPDRERPFLINHLLNEDHQLILKFSKSMERTQLQKIIAETLGDLSIPIPVDYPKNSNFILSLPQDIVGENTTLQLSETYCIDQLPLYECGNLTFGKPDSVQKGDCCINELLYNTQGENAPFIELYNTSDKTIDLSTFSIAILGTDSVPIRVYPLFTETALFDAGAYALISPDPVSVFNTYGYHGTPKIIKLPVFPTLNTSSGNIALLNARGNCMESFYYHTFLHHPTLPSLVNVSLERREPLLSAHISQNWTSGDILTGFASPGYKNSADPEIPVDEQRQVSGNHHFKPLFETLRLETGIPESELVILYKMDEPECHLTATLYTSNGLKAVRLAHDVTLDLEGEITWTNEWRTARTQTPGLYLLLLEYFSLSGKSGKQKIVIPIVP